MYIYYIYEHPMYMAMVHDQTDWNYHERLLLTITDVFEPSIEEKTAAIEVLIQQSNFVVWQYSATCCKTGENLLGNA